MSTANQCKRLQKQIEFKVSTAEMNEIFKCVGARYEKQIAELRSDLDTYKMQVSNLLKDKSQ